MEMRTFTAAGDDPAYLLVAGEYADAVVLGVLVGVSLDEAERAAAYESMQRATAQGPYAGAEAIPEDLIRVRVQVSAVIEPPAPDAGVVVFGSEALGLPVGSIIQPLPPDAPTWGGAPAPAPMLRTNRGWESTRYVAWDDPSKPLTPAALVRFRVMVRPQEEQ